MKSQDKRNYFVNKIKTSLELVKGKGLHISEERLILEVMKQAMVSRRTAIEYVNVALFNMEKKLNGS